MLILVIVLTIAALVLGIFLWQNNLRKALAKQVEEQQKLVQAIEEKSVSKEDIVVEKPEEVVVLPVSTIDWPTTISTLHQQISALGVDFLRCRALRSACSDVIDDFDYAGTQMFHETRLPSQHKNLGEFIAKTGSAHVSRQQTRLALREQIGPAQESCLKAKSSWEALATTVKQITLTLEETKETLSKEALIAYTAGKTLVAELDNPLKKECNKALGFKVPEQLPKGPSKQTLEPQVEMLVTTLKEALMLIPDMERQTDKTENKLRNLEYQKSRQITEPAKPTPEEVERYLSQMKEWATTKLEGQRAAHVVIDQYVTATNDFKLKLESLRVQVDKVSPLLSKQIDDQMLASIGGAYRLTKELEKQYQVYAGNCTKFSKSESVKTDPVTTVTTEETTLINQFQQLSRTLGYAIAQRTVAAIKCRAAYSKAKPDQPSLPGLKNDFTLQSYLQSFTEHFQHIEDRDKQLEFNNAEIASYSAALNARRDKVDSARSALAQLTSQTKVQMRDSTSDELRVAVAAAERICDTQYHANQWNNLIQ